MNIIGIANGAVLQRGADNTCSVYLDGKWNGILHSSLGNLEKTAENGYRLTGIPVGGPYTVTLSDDVGSTLFLDVYVGDVWLLAGQSNMEGAGRVRPADAVYEKEPIQAVRALYMCDTWKPAQPLLHQLWESSDPAHKAAFEEDRRAHAASPIHVTDFPPAKQRRGVGPGFFFAKAMYEMTGIPQGVIPAAVGGAPIEMWIPAEGDNYYSAAIRRLKLAGRNICGMFWYQGEGYGGDLTAYDAMFESMRRGFSELCGLRALPSVLVQTFKCTIPAMLNSKESAFSWSRFRAHQWEMAKTLPALITIANNDLELEDCIHLSAEAQSRLGKRAADAMRYLTDGVGDGEPEIESIVGIPDDIVTDWTVIRIRFRNLRGNLKSAGFPCGFTLSDTDSDDMPNEASIQHITVSGNEIYIRCELLPDALRKKSLWYAFGHTFHCNITDEAEHAIPAFGPIPLADLI